MEEVKDTVLKDLQELLRHLSAPPISLTILSSNAAKKRRRCGNGISSFSSSLGNQSSEDHFFEQARQEELKLFETYIGPYNDVLEGACRHVKSVYEDEIFYSETGLISIAGGKLTGYRKMAERVLNFVSKTMRIKNSSKTQKLRLSGGDFDSTEAIEEYIYKMTGEAKQINLKLELILNTFHGVH